MLVRILNSLVLVLGILLPISANAQLVKDIPGWSDTRWGMSPDDLMKVHPEFTIGVDRYGFTAGRLPDLTLGEAKFEVTLMFEGVGGLRKVGSSDPEPPKEQWRLVRVELRNPNIDACYRVTESLLGKYGPPNKQESKFYLWVLPTTTVRRVSHIDCTLIYHPSENTDNL